MFKRHERGPVPKTGEQVLGESDEAGVESKKDVGTPTQKAFEKHEEKLEKESEENIQKAIDTIEERCSIPPKELFEEKGKLDYDDLKYFSKIEQEVISQIPQLTHIELQKGIDDLCERNKDKNDNFQREFGLYVSALINRTLQEHIETSKKAGKTEDEIEDLTFNFNFENFKNRPSNIGFKNQEKCNLVIDGGVGGLCGYYMEGGTIVVDGNAGNSLGAKMKNGRIEVKGKTFDHIGNGMEEGEIVVDGDARSYGGNIKGGEVRVKGGIWAQNFTRMTGGKFIVDKGIEHLHIEDIPKNNEGEIWSYGEKVWPEEPKEESKGQ